MRVQKCYPEVNLKVKSYKTQQTIADHCFNINSVDKTWKYGPSNAKINQMACT